MASACATFVDEMHIFFVFNCTVYSAPLINGWKPHGKSSTKLHACISIWLVGYLKLDGPVFMCILHSAQYTESICRCVQFCFLSRKSRCDMHSMSCDDSICRSHLLSWPAHMQHLHSQFEHTKDKSLVRILILISFNSKVYTISHHQDSISHIHRIKICSQKFLLNLFRYFFEIFKWIIDLKSSLVSHSVIYNISFVYVK